MRYDPIDPKLFIDNRRRLVAALKRRAPGASDGPLAVFNSNDIMPTNADGTMPFRQNSDLFYLTGVDQEETVLILYPDAFDQDKHRELLFLRETNDHIATWEGEKLTRERAAELTGIP
ncbi:MAG: aminopeptidase P N-terminal domain-containing protein, partial [Bacteroidota bacterium]